MTLQFQRGSVFFVSVAIIIYYLCVILIFFKSNEPISECLKFVAVKFLPDAVFEEKCGQVFLLTSSFYSCAEQ